MVKKGKSSKEEEKKRPRAMEVVEIVDEEKGTAPLPSQDEKSEAPHEDTKETPKEMETEMNQVSEEKGKETVSEFFRKDSPPLAYTEISIHKKTTFWKVLLWALLVGIVVCAVGIGIVILAGGGMQAVLPKTTPTPAPTSITSPTPIPTPEVKRADVQVQVLNGSGKKGAASTMKTFLEEKGYTVAATGNAKRYDYEVSEIETKEGMDAVAELLKTDMSETYSVGSISATLEDTLPYDIRVIVGQE